MRRRLMHKDGGLGPADLTVYQPIREYSFDSRIPGPPRHVYILIIHENNSQLTPLTRGDLRRPRIPALAARDIDNTAVTPRLAIVIRNRILETEMRPLPRRLEDHDERVFPRGGIPRSHDALHAVAQVLGVRVAAQTAGRMSPARPAVEGIYAEGLLVVVGQLARVGELHEGLFPRAVVVAAAARRETHEGLPEAHAGALGGALLGGLGGEMPGAAAVGAPTDRYAEVRWLAVGTPGVVSERC